MVQSLPFTSTQESAPAILDPSKRLSRTMPPDVPSLMSTHSAEVPEMSFPATSLRSLLSGPQPLISHQLLSADPM